MTTLAVAPWLRDRRPDWLGLATKRTWSSAHTDAGKHPLAVASGWVPPADGGAQNGLQETHRRAKAKLATRVAGGPF